MNAQNVGDKALYSRLFRCLEAYPEGGTDMELENFANTVQRVVSWQLDMKSLKRTAAHFAAKGAGKNQGTDLAASSTAAKGEGKNQGYEIR